MYTPKHFDNRSWSEVCQLLAEFPLATLIANAEQGSAEHGSAEQSIEACHLPMVWQAEDTSAGYGCLYGHLAKKNPLHHYADRPASWLAIFCDQGHYISPNWYPSKAETHKEVPTYNYRSVHLRGRVRLLTEPSELKPLLAQQTQVFEQYQPQPWSLADAPEDYLNAMCRAIVGIRFEIDSFQAQFKLSQNKSVENQQGVIHGLRALASDEARRMARLVAGE